MFEGLFRPTHLLLVLAVALLVYGPKKLPQLGEALGRTLKDFKKAINEPADRGASTTKQLIDKDAAAPSDK